LSTYNLRRFAQPDVLRHISQTNLIAFLKNYEHYLETRGFTFDTDDDGNLDFELLAEVLLTPTESIDIEFVEALFFIQEMASDERFEELHELAEQTGVSHGPDCTAADLAVAIWLEDPDAIRRSHAEVLALKSKAFLHYRSDHTPPPAIEVPSPDKIAEVERSMGVWFDNNRRGSTTRILPVAAHEEGKMYFLVRHGMPFKREGKIENGKSSSVFYRPEFNDVVIYDQRHNVIALHNKSRGKKERKMYLRAMGELLFSDQEYFSDEKLFTLEPLRRLGEDALACADIPGIEEIRLIEIKILHGGTHNDVTTRKSNDLFASLKENGEDFPAGGRLWSAKFQIRFENATRPRTVAICCPNQTNYERNEDAPAIERWMRLRGFYEDWSDEFETEGNAEYDSDGETTAVA